MALQTLALLKPAALLVLHLVSGDLRDPANSAGRIVGEIELRVTALSGETAQVKLTYLGLHSSGLANWRGSQGELGLRNGTGEGKIRLDSGRLDLNLDVEVRFAERSERGYENLLTLPNGLRVAPVAKFSGTLSGSLDSGEGGTTLQHSVLRLSKAKDKESVTTLGIDFEASVTGEAPPIDCHEGTIGRGGIVNLKRISFNRPQASLGATGASFSTQELQAANTVWARCCLRFSEMGSITLPDSPARTNEDRHAIVSSVSTEELIGVVPVVPIFFVDKLTSGDGGGTLEADSVILEDSKATVNSFLLAHELGHVLGGMRIKDVSFPDIMKPDLMPTQAPPNRLANCTAVLDSDKITDRSFCCLDPDP